MESSYRILIVVRILFRPQETVLGNWETPNCPFQDSQQHLILLAEN